MEACSIANNLAASQVVLVNSELEYVIAIVRAP